MLSYTSNIQRVNTIHIVYMVLVATVAFLIGHSIFVSLYPSIPSLHNSKYYTIRYINENVTRTTCPLVIATSMSHFSRHSAK